MNKKIVVGVVVAACILAGIVILLLWNYLPPTQREKGKNELRKEFYRTLNSYIAKAKKSKFTIKGKIVDEKGAPVNDVTVHILQECPRLDGSSRDNINSKRTIDSNFCLELFGGLSVRLDFYKDGYHGVENKKFNLKQSGGDLTDSSTVLNVDNLTIVMEPYGKLAKTKRINNPFFITNEKYFTSYSIPKQERTNNVSYEKVKNLSLGTIYPDAERNNNGDIKKIAIDKVTERLGPRTTYIKMAGGKGDGFFVYKNNPARGIISIQEAPEAGYVKQMKFNWPEDINKEIYFCYKHGNIYGKGVIHSLSCSSDGRIKIGITFYQNVETSSDPRIRRNLRTR